MNNFESTNIFWILRTNFETEIFYEKPKQICKGEQIFKNEQFSNFEKKFWNQQ